MKTTYLFNFWRIIVPISSYGNDWDRVLKEEEEGGGGDKHMEVIEKQHQEKKKAQ